MAAANLLALIDDIASLLDDVATMTKAATQKTAGVLGDDLALNSQQVAGVRADRELPVVWAVAKGSLVNKAILVPVALLISAFLPWAIVPMLMIGGLYLCFDGAEKLAHTWLHRTADDTSHHDASQALSGPTIDLAALEKEKIKGAIRTDFVLSIEIIVIALGVLADKPTALKFFCASPSRPQSMPTALSNCAGVIFPSYRSFPKYASDSARFPAFLSPSFSFWSAATCAFCAAKSAFSFSNCACTTSSMFTSGSLDSFPVSPEKVFISAAPTLLVNTVVCSSSLAKQTMPPGASEKYAGSRAPATAGVSRPRRAIDCKYGGRFSSIL